MRNYDALKNMRVKNNKMKRRINLKALILLSSFLIIAVQIVYTIQVSSYGGKLSSLDDDYNILLRENENLTQKIVESTSMNMLNETAKNDGFIKPGNVMYVRETGFVASAR